MNVPLRSRVCLIYTQTSFCTFI